MLTRGDGTKFQFMEKKVARKKKKDKGRKHNRRGSEQGMFKERGGTLLRIFFQSSRPGRSTVLLLVIVYVSALVQCYDWYSRILYLDWVFY